jgi:ATP-dependent DNA ligase
VLPEAVKESNELRTATLMKSSAVSQAGFPLTSRLSIGFSSRNVPKTLICDDRLFISSRMVSTATKYQPMLCELGSDKLLDYGDYLFEPKLEGIRCIAELSNKVRLFSRRGEEISGKYPLIVSELGHIGHHCILDGEILYSAKENVATYEIFDILEKDGILLLDTLLIERKTILAETMEKGETIKMTTYVTGRGRELFEEMIKRGMEGVVAKDQGSFYLPGRRKWTWIKIKKLKTIDAVIVGYTSKAGQINLLGVALYNEEQLVYSARVKMGFFADLEEKLKKTLTATNTPLSPVVNPEQAPKGMQWVKPMLVAKVGYREITGSGELRGLSFKRLKQDKPAKECSFDQLWKGRIMDCIETFNKEEPLSVHPYEHKKLYEDFIFEQPTLLRGEGVIPYAWVKAKLEGYRRGF